jgi:hypothetical protein
MLTQIIFLLLAFAIVVLVVELTRQLGWLRRTIDAASSRKPLQDQDDLSLLRKNGLKPHGVIKLASRLLKEASIETSPTKRSRKQREKKSPSRSKYKK